MTALADVFVCPPLDGPRTGGTLYNAGLLGALEVRGRPVSTLGPGGARRALRAGVVARYWVDTLFLDSVPELRRENAGAILGLLVHYLPSLVSLERVPVWRELSSLERAALEASNVFLVTSAFMRRVLSGFGIPLPNIVTVEPGFWVGVPGAASRDAGSARKCLSALMVANLLPGKGIAPFLEALAPLLDVPARDVSLHAARDVVSRDVSLRLSVVGSGELDTAYAAKCAAIVAADARLSASVRFEGALAHDATLARMRASDVLVSASRMESFGLALAEARALGLPILARRGGNVEAHVDARAGGELTSDDGALARALVALAARPGEAHERAARAQACRVARTWSDAASDFVAGCAALAAAAGARWSAV